MEKTDTQVTWTDIKPALSPKLISILNDELKLPNVMKV